MKLAIFGASGRSGIPLVKKALQQGHQVTALVRNPAKLALQHDHFQVIQGDVRDLNCVEQAIQGSDAVISVLGPTGGKDDVMAVAADHLIQAMQKHQVRRLITLTGAGVEDPNDQPKLINHVISFLLKTTAREVYEQSYRHVEKVRASGLDWTVVRVPRLTEQPGTGHIRVGYVGVGTGTVITREDIADFILEEVQRNRYVCKAPMISN